MIANYDFEDFKLISGKENLSDVFDTELNIFNNIREPNVKGSISLYDLLLKIKYNLFSNISINDYLTRKYVDQEINPLYDEMKACKMTVCYNAIFNGRKDLNNMKSPTNLMFLDVDGFQSKEDALIYKEEIIKRHEWIVTCCLSLSRNGLHMVILVDKIIDNKDFNNKYDLINQWYFDGRLDDNAKSLTRHTIIPADHNIYINENPKVLDINRILLNSSRLFPGINNKQLDSVSNENQKGTRSVYKKEKVICTEHAFSNSTGLKEITNISARVDGLRFEEPIDEDVFIDPNIPVYIPEGVNVIGINLFPYKHKKVLEGNRYNTIGLLSMQLIYLNTNKLKDKPDNSKKLAITKYLQSVNKEICNPPLPYRELVNSVNGNWNKYVAGELDMTYLFEKKRSFWSKRSTLEANEKRKVTCKIKNEPIVSASKKRIADAIESFRYNEKITQKKVAEVCGMNIQTVKKYWSEYKFAVGEHNEYMIDCEHEWCT